ncbi:putative sporulation protein YtaF [Paenibacillus sp. DS2015]|uniref:sporulation membrane protein YtaF n=1 Tax=Paenibacillus sp. DS2015 TaxID=3373917 RepID=UPI003D19D032
MLSHMVSMMLLAFALSLDSFGVGITYGLRKMKIPLLSIIIISLLSGVIIFLSMQVGVLLSHVVSGAAASAVGAIILIVMGSWSLVQLLMQKEKGVVADTAKPNNIVHRQAEEVIEIPVFSLEIRKFGLVIQILRTPSSADVDKSGSISGFEAMWLGIALSLDAFGAGLGAALLGFSPLWTAAVIAVFSGSFLVMGMRAGFRFATKSWTRHVTALPALMLIIMGIMKLL